MITDLSQPIETTVKHSVRCLSDSGTYHTEEIYVLREHWMTVCVNEDTIIKMLCTPKELPALIVGHLCSEGMIRGPEAVRSVSIARDGAHAQVFAALAREAGGKPAPASGALTTPFWKPEWIMELAAMFAQGAPLYNLTQGAHSCRLMTEKKVVYTCEDISRHNAIDKAIGRALLDGVELSRCIVFSSGRIQSDIVQKLITTGIPLIASNAVPTDRAIVLAENNHIELICPAPKRAL